jgi:crossover junction endodeoxyribonuclease RuvC
MHVDNAVNVLAVDPSLNAMGHAGRGSRGVWIPPKSHASGVRRLLWLRDCVLTMAIEGRADVVVIEGYSFASRGRAVVSLGELGGVLRTALHEHGIPYVEVPPSALKKYATGKGNAGKELVLVEAVKRLGYEGSSTDEADAMWLRQMGMDHYGHPDAVVVPKSNRDALEKVEWPAIRPPIAAVA